VARFDLKPASNSSKFGLCSFCFIVQTSNSSYLKERLVISCPCCPNEVKYVFAEAVAKSQGRNLVNKEKRLAELFEAAAEDGVDLNIPGLNINNQANSRSGTSTSRSSTASSAAGGSRVGGRHTPDYAAADTHFSRFVAHHLLCFFSRRSRRLVASDCKAAGF
jgi:hypothetical protein